MKKKKTSENLITRKIRYTLRDREMLSVFSDIQRQFSNILHFTYNRIFEKPDLKTREITALQHTMKHIDINSHLLNSAMYVARGMVTKEPNKQIVFGGKKLFMDRQKGLISYEEFNIKKLSPIFSVGESMCNGNRLFSIIDENTILFKPSRNEHFILDLITSKSCKQELKKLQTLMMSKQIPVTCSINSEYVYLTFDYNKIKEVNLIEKYKKDRIFAIDQNPNYIGWSVIDWLNEDTYTIVDKGVISIKPLNDKHFAFKKEKISPTDSKRKNLNNKRRFEVEQVGISLVNIAKHYKCSVFSIENLTIENSDKGKGSRYNSLCNNLWCRNVLYSQIRKYCKLYNIRLQEVIANYSSFIGNLVYREERLPDMVLASIEISRRAYEFLHQYIYKDKVQKKNIILPKLELVKNKVVQSLEELGYTSQFKTLIELYSALKKSKQKYRLSFEDLDSSRFSSNFVKNQKKTYTVLYRFL